MLIIYTLSDEKIKDRNKRIEELILKIGTGNKESLGELYELIQTDVYAYAISKTGNSHDAEDITHDTFVQIYRYSPSYRPEGKPLAWIFTIELNLSRRQRQIKWRTIPLDDAISTEEPSYDPADDIANSEFVKELLSKLCPDEREIIALRVVSGLKHWEIARLLDKPLSTVLSRYNRAIKKLQIIVKESEG